MHYEVDPFGRQGNWKVDPLEERQPIRYSTPILPQELPARRVCQPFPRNSKIALLFERKTRQADKAMAHHATHTHVQENLLPARTARSVDRPGRGQSPGGDIACSKVATFYSSSEKRRIIRI